MNQEIKERIEKIKRGEVPEGYKTTKSGTIPLNWDSIKLRRLAIPIKEKAQQRKLEVLSITAGVGFVNQAEKFGKEIAGAQYQNYTVLRKGDFSYNKGNSKTYPQGCIYMLEDRNEAAVPNVFNSFRFKAGVHTYYYKHLFINGFLNKQLHKYINAGVRNDGLLNLYDDDFYNCELPVPSLPEQEKIAEILSTWDKAIGLLENLIEQKKKQKKWLMQNLLNPDSGVRLPGFEGEWIEHSFKNLFEKISVKNHQINSSGYCLNGIYPVIDQGQKKIVAYSNNTNKVFRCPKNGVIVFGDHTCEIKYINFNFIIGADGTQVLKVRENNHTYFLYNYLLNNPIRNTGYNRHFKYLKEIKFIIPEFDEQKAIASVLSTADKEIELLEQKLEQLQKQKKALMQLLLTGIVRVTVNSLEGR